MSNKFISHSLYNVKNTSVSALYRIVTSIDTLQSRFVVLLNISDEEKKTEHVFHKCLSLDSAKVQTYF